MEKKKSKGQLTRERLLVVAAELFQARGYHAVGLTEICAAGRVPKGSVYYHFPKGKEAIALAVIHTSKIEVGQSIESATLGCQNLDQFIAVLGAFFSENLSTSNFTKGCPITTISLEMAGTSESIRLACSNAFKYWLSQTSLALQKFGVKTEACDQTAEFIFATIEGALILARAQKSVAPISRSIANIQHYLSITGYKNEVN